MAGRPTVWTQQRTFKLLGLSNCGYFFAVNLYVLFREVVQKTLQLWLHSESLMGLATKTIPRTTRIRLNNFGKPNGPAKVRSEWLTGRVCEMTMNIRKEEKSTIGGYLISRRRRDMNAKGNKTVMLTVNGYWKKKLFVKRYRLHD